MSWLKRSSLPGVMLLTLLATPAAAERCCITGERGPYGDYCPGPQSGWYGSGGAIKTAEQAKKAIQEYFGGSVTVTITGEKGCFFEADVSEKGKLKDRVIIHRKDGRIRSIY